DAAATGGAFVIVEEHEIDVAAVVELLAAVLAEGQDHAAGRRPGIRKRLAKPVRDLAQGRGQRHFEGRIGDPRNVARDLFQRAIADDVIRADAQRLPLPKTTEDPQDSGILEGGIDLALQLFLHFPLARAAPRRQAAECRAEVAQRLEADRRRDVRQIAPAALAVANLPVLEQGPGSFLRFQMMTQLFELHEQWRRRRRTLAIPNAGLGESPYLD